MSYNEIIEYIEKLKDLDDFKKWTHDRVQGHLAACHLIKEKIKSCILIEETDEISGYKTIDNGKVICTYSQKCIQHDCEHKTPHIFDKCKKICKKNKEIRNKNDISPNCIPEINFRLFIEEPNYNSQGEK